MSDEAARAAMDAMREWEIPVKIKCATCWATLATVTISNVDTVGAYTHPLPIHACAEDDLARVAGWQADLDARKLVNPDPIDRTTLERLRNDPVLVDRLRPDRISERAREVANAVLSTVTWYDDE